MSDGSEGMEEGDVAGANWLLSMADLVSLLLAFFIMMFAMSHLEADKWRRLTQIVSSAIPAVAEMSAPVARMPAPQALPGARGGLGVDLGYLDAVLAEKFAHDPMLRDAVLERGADGLVIALPGELLFAPGAAEPSPDAAAALMRLGGMLGNIANGIEVRGYADPTPIHTTAFPSNWELSLARAVAVASALGQAGRARGILALGQADARFGDLSAALPEAARQRLARRVDVVVRPNVTPPQAPSLEPQP
ncbi:MAG TPA: flagellar motor protein MotB [Alphaproteobacteria bacterium]|nr:flagellar motor protein MotB [Alphaproteobacteria bacterium]